MLEGDITGRDGEISDCDSGGGALDVCIFECTYVMCRREADCNFG